MRRGTNNATKDKGNGHRPESNLTPAVPLFQGQRRKFRHVSRAGPTLFLPFCAHCAPSWVGSKSPCRLYDSTCCSLLALATCGNSHPHALAPIRYLRSHPPRRRAADGRADGPSGYGELLLRRGEPRRRSPRRRRRRRQSRLRSLRRGRPLPPLPWCRRVHADRGTEPPSILKVLPISSVGSVVRGAGASSQQLGHCAWRGDGSVPPRVVPLLVCGSVLWFCGVRGGHTGVAGTTWFVIGAMAILSIFG